ncbi:hypothetical protein [Nocardia sp. CA-290969]
MTGRHRAPVAPLPRFAGDALFLVIVYGLPIASAVVLPLLLMGWLL